MDPQPDAWVSAMGAMIVIIALAVAINHGWNNPSAEKPDWDLFKLGEIYEEKERRFYKLSPTNVMREIDRTKAPTKKSKPSEPSEISELKEKVERLKYKLAKSNLEKKVASLEGKLSESNHEAANPLLGEFIEALTSLGYKKAEAKKAVMSCLEKNSPATVEEFLKAFYRSK